jgi:hypothetical protein
MIKKESKIIISSVRGECFLRSKKMYRTIFRTKKLGFPNCGKKIGVWLSVIKTRGVVHDRI